MKRIMRLIREPIVLFLVLGTMLFILYQAITGSIESNNKQIHISKAQIALLEETYTKTWNRSPGDAELDALINDFIMDEIFYKEAVAMGLDKTDLTIKQRLRQVMEMMMDDYTTIYPSEDQLRSYLEAHPDKFRRDDRISFRQLHFTVEEKEEANAFLEKLKASESAYEAYTGGLLLLQEMNANQSSSNVGKLFGPYFSTAIFDLETGNWTGPLESSYGWHLVYIYEKVPGKLPDLDDIWDLVEREWSVERKKEIKEEQYRLMREAYRISVEMY
jgi:hypothetical protein